PRPLRELSCSPAYRRAGRRPAARVHCGVVCPRAVWAGDPARRGVGTAGSCAHAPCGWVSPLGGVSALRGRVPTLDSGGGRNVFVFGEESIEDLSWCQEAVAFAGPVVELVGDLTQVLWGVDRWVGALG